MSPAVSVERDHRRGAIAVILENIKHTKSDSESSNFEDDATCALTQLTQVVIFDFKCF